MDTGEHPAVRSETRITLLRRVSLRKCLGASRIPGFKPSEHNMLGVDIAETVFELSEGGNVYDRGVDGSECRWARVLTYDPPNRVVISWDISRNGKSRPILRKPARSMCDSSPRRQIARGSSSSTGTSIATATAGRQSARVSTETPVGRSTYIDSPTSWPHDFGPTDEPNKTDKEGSSEGGWSGHLRASFRYRHSPEHPP
jgi:hypothetical protein